MSQAGRGWDDGTSVGASAPAPGAGTHGEYARRIDAVIDHLREHLDRPVPLSELAGVAGFSDFHFHRIFSAVCGETVNDFTTRLRLEKAARLLRYSDQKASDIALDCGWSWPSSFSRAFYARYGLSPSQFRRRGGLQESKICEELMKSIEYAHPQSADGQETAFRITWTNAPQRSVAYIRVVNAFEGHRVLEAFDMMIRWARAQGILSQGVLFGMSTDDPHVTPRAQYRYEVCFASSQPFQCAEGMSTLVLPATLYAVTEVSGDIGQVASAWDFLYRGWLIESPYEPEHAPALEIYLNKERATDWSHFDLQLCLPVRPLA